MNGKMTIKILITLFSLGFLSACALHTPFRHGPCDVNFQNFVPKNCEYRGMVIARELNSFGLEKCHPRQLDVDARLTLRAQALQLGANWVVITRRHISYMPPRSNYRGMINTYGLVGQAYRCYCPR